MISDSFLIDEFGKNKIGSIVSNAITFYPNSEKDFNLIMNKLKKIIDEFDLKEEEAIIKVSKGQSRLLKYKFGITFYTKIEFN